MGGLEQYNAEMLSTGIIISDGMVPRASRSASGGINLEIFFTIWVNDQRVTVSVELITLRIINRATYNGKQFPNPKEREAR